MQLYFPDHLFETFYPGPVDSYDNVTGLEARAFRGRIWNNGADIGRGERLTDGHEHPGKDHNRKHEIR